MLHSVGANKAPGLVASALVRLFERGLHLGSRRNASEQFVPILSFHRVSSFRPDHWMTLTPERFRGLLEALSQKWQFVSLANVDHVLAAGRPTQPIVAVCFDDCYGCNFRFAIPTLRALRIPATFFVTTGLVDSKQPFAHDVARGFHNLPNFTSDELRDIAADSLFELGSHAVTHVDFRRELPAAAASRELGESKAFLEALAGRPVTRFAIPFGSQPHCTPQVVRAARTAGYQRIYSFFSGRNQILADGKVAFVLNRLCAVYDDPKYVHAGLLGYRGRHSFLPSPKLQLGPDFQPSELIAR